MFDLKSFVRQNLPPHRRNPLTVALGRILFGPAQTTMDGLVGTRVALVESIRATGQTFVLESLLTQAISDYTNSAVYIAEGTSPDIDFLVIVPSNVPDSEWRKLRVILDRYKLAGKRYALSKSLIYEGGGGGPGPLAWAPGFPYIDKGLLHIAINRIGTYYVTVVDSDGVVYANGNAVFLNGSEVQLTVPAGKRYTVTVGSLTAEVSYDRGQIEVVAGYTWNPGNNRTLILGFNATEPPEIRLVYPNKTTQQTKTASAFGVTLAGEDFAYSVAFDGLPNGVYEIDANVKSSRYNWYVILTGNADENFLFGGLPPEQNQPPFVNVQASEQVAVVGVPYSQVLPADTFLDVDGSITSMSVLNGTLPAGVSWQLKVDKSLVISGTPTTVQTKTVQVEGKDDDNATALMHFDIRVISSDRPDDPPPQGSGADQLVNQNPGYFKGRVEWSGGKARIVNDAQLSVGGGENVYYFIGGQLPLSSLPTTYDYSPGDEVIIYLAISNTPNVYMANWTKKGSCRVVFGAAPN